jgi:hypothetical protein
MGGSNSNNESGEESNTEQQRISGSSLQASLQDGGSTMAMQGGLSNMYSLGIESGMMA